MTTLRDEVEAIEYEHWMLLETGNILRTRAANLPTVEWNAHVEAHVIHLRNVTEFLFQRADKKVDARLLKAADETYGACWLEDWPDGMYDTVFRRAAEEVAHLSRGRLTDPKTNWLPEFAESVDGHFQRWLAAASDDTRRLFSEATRRHGALFQIAEDVASTTTAANRHTTISTSPTNTRIIGL